MSGVQARLWTVGHSTHTLAEFVGLLHDQRIARLCDVRTVPKSRRHPHFWAEALSVSLPEQAVAYRHLAGLGGWRHSRADSPNGAWRNDSFRGYADYALTDAFVAALDELCGIAREQRTAIMCSEGLWWRCHRRLIADRLTAGGWEVSHIGTDGRISPHRLPDFAEPQPDGTVRYPASAGT
ncbi:MAG: DUF488 domain-containing protein [Solirubrobacteraceae bacterium]